MQVVYLVPIPHQQLKVRLDNQYFTLSVYQKGDAIYLDASIEGLDLIRFVPCLNLTPTLCREYFGVRGQLMVVDTEGTDDPNDYRGLGVRWFLVYFDESELPLLTPNFDTFNDPLTGLPIGIGDIVTPPLDPDDQRAKRLTILENRFKIYQPCDMTVHGDTGDMIIPLMARGTAVPPTSNLSQEERVEALEQLILGLTDSIIQLEPRNDPEVQWPILIRGTGGAFTLGGTTLDERLDSIESVLDTMSYTVLFVESPFTPRWVLTRR